MLKSDSRLIKEGDTFIAIKGDVYDGHMFIEEAIKNGATEVIVEKGEYNVTTKKVVSTKEYLNSYLKDKMPNIKIIGVTGTNGKTTTCYLIWQMFKMLGVKCAYIGTLGYFIDGKEKELINTTPGSIELFELINHSYKCGCRYVVMEVSSQALSQGRVDFIGFDYAIFTNLTQDHLDYHKTMDSYACAKQKLFKLLKSNGISIINNDDINSELFKIKNYVTYGYSECDYEINGITNFYLNDELYKTKLIGKYNTYNMVAAICLFYQIGYNYKDLRKVVAKCTNADGRLDLIVKNRKMAIVDYAHTPDAVLNVLTCVNLLKHNKIITVIGCGGNRDKSKRPIMGEVAVQNSDHVIFTSDNPRYEDPDDIINDMISGLDKDNYEIESNRENAIKKGIQLLGKNDILILLGKGHEKYQIIKDERIFFDDKQIIIDNM